MTDFRTGFCQTIPLARNGRSRLQTHSLDCWQPLWTWNLRMPCQPHKLLRPLWDYSSHLERGIQRNPAGFSRKKSFVFCQFFWAPSLTNWHQTGTEQNLRYSEVSFLKRIVNKSWRKMAENWTTWSFLGTSDSAENEKFLTELTELNPLALGTGYLTIFV